jgi:hypothetical protein
MLPMAYAPVGSEEVPVRKFEPALPGAGNLDIWPGIADRAAAYWEEVAAHELVSADFGALAAKKCRKYLAQQKGANVRRYKTES